MKDALIKKLLLATCVGVVSLVALVAPAHAQLVKDVMVVNVDTDYADGVYSEHYSDWEPNDTGDGIGQLSVVHTGSGPDPDFPSSLMPGSGIATMRLYVSEYYNWYGPGTVPVSVSITYLRSGDVSVNSSLGMAKSLVGDAGWLSTTGTHHYDDGTNQFTTTALHPASFPPSGTYYAMIQLETYASNDGGVDDYGNPTEESSQANAIFMFL